LSGGAKTECLRRCRETDASRRPSSSNEAVFKECAERCGTLSGQARYGCMRTCASHRREQGGDRDDAKSVRYRECEGRCGVIEGPMRYKCVQNCVRTSR